MFKGVNDSQAHSRALVKLLDGLRCRVNLIRFHPIPGTPLKSSDNETIVQFRDRLNDAGLVATIRASRGEDIFAACGLLSTKELSKEEGEKDY
jgi:23S rRNA (adenine2503-C2)-methyltransferase